MSSPSSPHALLLEGVQILKKLLKNLPNSPGVYRMLDEKENVLYVGKAKNIKKRVTSYTAWERLPTRTKRMVSRIRSVEVITTHTEAEAFLLEANLIKKFLPAYNILLRDDKSFPYICIATDHPFPQIFSHRGEKSRPGYYFGPFAESSIVHETLPLLQRAFLLRSCSDSVFESRTRPCLLYHIKRCSAPCVQKICQEDYQDLVDTAQKFLSGKTSDLQEAWAEKMMEESQELRYEQAAVFRDRIRALTKLQQGQQIVTSAVDRADVIGIFTHRGKSSLQVFLFQHGTNLGNKVYFLDHEEETDTDTILTTFLTQFYLHHEIPPRILLNMHLKDTVLLEEALSKLSGNSLKIECPQRGIKSKLVRNAVQNAQEALKRHVAERASHRLILERLQELFEIPQIPRRIEVYDNSHLQGQHPYGAMIVVGPEGLQKNAYRTFGIRGKDVSSCDDYAMMREVLTRRLKNLQTKEQGDVFPDLILLDGGRGHLKVGEDVFQDLGIQGIALGAISKGPKRNQGDETFHRPGKDSFKLPPHDPLLFFLEQIRDEAHRFAITSNRKKRIKDIRKSQLDEIDGIGHTRKKALLQHFGSLQEIKKAGVFDLCSVHGISESLARSIYNYFHGVNSME